MNQVRAAAASVKLTDDNMEALGSRVKLFDRPWEGEFRANAIVMDAGQKICLISLDSLRAPLNVTKAAAERIAAATGIPVENILICATHTHSAPGFRPNEEFLRRMEEGSVLAAVKAAAAVDDTWSGAGTELLFGLGQEATVGRNSRILLKNGAIGWHGYAETDMVRPTGPCDPDLYLMAVRGTDGKYDALAFNHSVHNIGRVREDCLSPCFYGLAALEIERRHGATTLFLPGAIGSTHCATYKNSGLPPAERVRRVVDAVEGAMEFLRPALPGPVKVINREFNYRVRRFDEAGEEAAVKSYMEKYGQPQEAQAEMEFFRKMRKELTPHQGETRHTRLQVIRLGNIVFVGIPGQMFARLGLELRHRSPFRHTCIVGLANEDLGYIPDRKAHALGGYQTWAGWHSILEAGTGELMVDQCVDMLEELNGIQP